MHGRQQATHAAYKTAILFMQQVGELGRSMREARDRSSVAMLGRKALDAEAPAVTAAATAAGDAATRILEACDYLCVEYPRVCMYAAGRILAAPGRGREYVALRACKGSLHQSGGTFDYGSLHPA